jgi:predicted DNA binding CopG/RHH family protein
MAKIPRFTSDKDAATFWDTHSLADFEDELRPARNVVFVKPERQVISLRLDRSIVNALKRLAQRRGLGYSSLLRMWVLERFDRETHLRLKQG